MWNIEVVANGWIVRPRIGQHEASSLEDTHVFNSFTTLTRWLKANAMPKGN